MVTDGDQAVREVLREHLTPLVGIADAQGDNHNVFLEAISPTIAISSKLTRSLTSRLGKRFAGMARDLAVLRYGKDRVPAIIGCADHGIEAGGLVPFAEDTAVYTRFDKAETRRAATQLLRQAGTRPEARIGTPVFREAFRERLQALQALPLEAEAWSVRVDLYVDDPAIGMAELESGGELDSSNVKGQPEKLILAGLAYGDPEVPLHFCTAYANRGEGRPIGGGLPGYLAYASDEVVPSAGLVVGSRWWLRVLPPGMSFARFIEIFAEVARELEIVPEEIRG